LIEITIFNYPACHTILFLKPRSQYSEFSIEQLSGGFLLDSEFYFTDPAKDSQKIVFTAGYHNFNMQKKILVKKDKHFFQHERVESLMALPFPFYRP
jgi:hypothetical protein